MARPRTPSSAGTCLNEPGLSLSVVVAAARAAESGMTGYARFAQVWAAQICCADVLRGVIRLGEDDDLAAETALFSQLLCLANLREGKNFGDRNIELAIGFVEGKLGQA